MAPDSVSTCYVYEHSPIYVLFKNQNSLTVGSSPFLSSIATLCRNKRVQKKELRIVFADRFYYNICNPINANSDYLRRDHAYECPSNILELIYYYALSDIQFYYQASRESSFCLDFSQANNCNESNNKKSLFVVGSIYIWAYKKRMLFKNFIGQNYANDSYIEDVYKKAEKALKAILVIQPTIREYIGDINKFEDLFGDHSALEMAMIRADKCIFLRQLGLLNVEYLDYYINYAFKKKSYQFNHEDIRQYITIMNKYQDLQNTFWKTQSCSVDLKDASQSLQFDYPSTSLKANADKLKREFEELNSKIKALTESELKKEVLKIINYCVPNLDILRQVLSVKQNAACNNFKDFYKIKSEILKHIFERLKSVILRVDKEMDNIEWVPDFVCNNYIWETAKKIEKGSNVSKVIVKHILGPDGTNYSNTLSKEYYSAFAGLIKSIGDVKIRDKFQQAGLSCFCKCLTEHRSKQRRIALFHQAINKVLTHEWKIELWVDFYIAIKTGMINKEEMNEHIINILRELKQNGVKNICDIMNEPNTRNITLMYALNIMGYSCSFYKPYKLDSFENSKCLNSCVTSTTKEDFSMKFRITMFFEVTLKDEILNFGKVKFREASSIYKYLRNPSWIN